MAVTVRDNSEACISALRDAVAAGLESGGSVAVDAARSMVPVDTGRLRDSMRHEVGEEGTTLMLVVSANTDYAAYVELGTRTMHARPYLKPAVMNNANAIVAEISAAVSDALSNG